MEKRGLGRELDWGSGERGVDKLLGLGVGCMGEGGEGSCSKGG